MQPNTEFATIPGETQKDQRERAETYLPKATPTHADPNCPRCSGTGDIEVPFPQVKLPAGVKLFDMASDACPCTVAVRRRQQLDKISPGLSMLAPAADSILAGRLRHDLRVRADRPVLLAHLARALQGGPVPSIRIVTDLDVASTWVANAKQVRDSEVADHRDREEVDGFSRIVDLAAPPQLLVLLLGVKTAEMRGLGGVVQEVVQCRAQRGKPTWVVDSDSRPYGPASAAWSADLGDLFSTWPGVRLSSAQEAGEHVDLAAAAQAAQAAPGSAAGTAGAVRNTMVAEALDKLKDVWTPSRYDSKGNAWGICPPSAGGCGAVDKYSVFAPTRQPKPDVTPQALGKCSKPGCALFAVRPAARLAEQGATAPAPDAAPSPQAAPAVPQAAPAATVPQAAKKRSAREVLIDLLRIGSSDPPVAVPRATLEQHAALRSLEAAKQQLRQEGVVIESTREGNAYSWIHRR